MIGFLAVLAVGLATPTDSSRAHDSSPPGTETGAETGAATGADLWKTETCLLRGCESLVPSLLEFIARTYAYYDTRADYSEIAVLPAPEVHFISRKALVEKACPVQSCDAIGWFPNKGHVVYMASDQDVVNDMHARSILVHELVHYVQHAIGLSTHDNRCQMWKARELQAYGIQYHWMRVNRMRVQTPAYNLRLAGFSRINCDYQG